MSTEEQSIEKYTFDNECTIYQAAQLHASLIELMNGVSKVQLDISSIEEVDASFMQLLASAHIKAKQNNIDLVISGHSDCVYKFAERIHCKVIFNDTDLRENLEVANDEC